MASKSTSFATGEMIIQCPAFELPESPLLREDSHVSLRNHRVRIAASLEDASKIGNTGDFRQWEKKLFNQSEAYKDIKNRYPADVETGLVGGVLTETFRPSEGIAQGNINRVLINLHGGGFCSGSCTNSRLESMPVAELGKIKVVSVDYRMAPEYKFPAATDDVVSVYDALLQDYTPEGIGFLGVSSGAQLTAMTLVRLQEQGLPLPGAVSMIAGGATRIIGDSVEIVGSILKAAAGLDLKTIKRDYFEGADLKDPRVTPALSDSYMSAFPPSLLVSSTRDYLLSSVIATHRQLVNLGGRS